MATVEFVDECALSHTCATFESTSQPSLATSTRAPSYHPEVDGEDQTQQIPSDPRFDCDSRSSRSFDHHIEIDDNFACDIEAWLQEVDLLDQSDAVLKWCKKEGVGNLEDLVSLAAELAVDIGLKPAQALNLRLALLPYEVRRVAASASAHRKRAISSPSRFGEKKSANIVEKLLNELQLDRSQADRFWRMAGNAAAGVCSRRLEDKFHSENEMNMFAQDLIDSLGLMPPQSNIIISNACELFEEVQPRRSAPSFVGCNREALPTIGKLHDVGVSANLEPHSQMKNFAIPEQRQDKCKQSLQGNSFTSNKAFEKRKRRAPPSGGHSSPLRHSDRRGETWLSPNRSFADCKSPSSCAKPKSPCEKQSWDSSWNDNWHLHSSQQKFFDPMHNKQMYSMMHYRSSSTEAKHLRDGCTDESSRKCVSIASTSPGSPCSSNASFSSSPPSRRSPVSRPMSTASCSLPSASGWRRTNGWEREEPSQTGRHGSRFTVHGSTGKPWSAAPFYNDREHPFMGHYYDREGEMAAYRRGKRPPSSMSTPNLTF